MSNNNLTKVGIGRLYIQRELESDLKKYLPLRQILAIIGPRRSGKTTFLLHLQKKLPKSVFLNFEDENLLKLFEEDLSSFVKLYFLPYQTIIIDEFQYAQNGGKNLKYLFDTYPDKKIIISGSSSLELTVKAVRFLVGRILSFRLYPFSFSEFLGAKNPRLKELTDSNSSPSPSLIKQIEPYLDEYLIFGGYPEVALAKDLAIKKTLLENIYQLYFLKDVRSLTQLASDWKLKNLIKILAANLGGIVNYSQLASDAGIDFKTLKSYLNFLEKTFIIFPVRPFFRNKAKELVKNPKIYFVDAGLRNALIGAFEPKILRRDTGWLNENLVALDLYRANIEPHFWRTKSGAEVDFVFEKEGAVFPVEVKTQLKVGEISRSFKSFLNLYRPKTAFIANLGFFGRKIVGQTLINFVPIYRKFSL